MDATDSTLLRKFANGSDHRAFGLLVERYQDLVFSAALRRTGQRGLAEECAQEVFLLLADKAHLLKSRTNLAGWLHETSYKLASNKMKSEVRRMKREQQYAEEARTQPTIWEMPQADHAVVDDALARLGATDREAVILRFFQEREFGEIAAIQGTSAEAVRKRVNRSLEKMAMIFRRKGLATSGATAVGGILAGSIVPAPAALLPAATAAATVPVAPGIFVTLLNLIITMNKIQTTAIALVIVALPLAVQQVSKADLQRKIEQETPITSAPPPGNRKRPSVTIATAPQNQASTRASTPEEAEPKLPDMLGGSPDDLARMELEIRNLEARRRAAELATALDLDPQKAAAITELALANTKRMVDQQAAVMKALGEGNFDFEQTEIGLFDGVEGMLSANENERYQEWTGENERAEQLQMAEQFTIQDLADLQEVVPLDGERRQKVFAVLMEENQARWASNGEQLMGAEAETRQAELERVRLEKLGQILTAREMEAYRLMLEDEDSE